MRVKSNELKKGHGLCGGKTGDEILEQNKFSTTKTSTKQQRKIKRKGVIVIIVHTVVCDTY